MKDLSKLYNMDIGTVVDKVKNNHCIIGHNFLGICIRVTIKWKVRKTALFMYTCDCCCI